LMILPRVCVVVCRAACAVRNNDHCLADSSVAWAALTRQ
jgi:hypothetical protein